MTKFAIITLIILALTDPSARWNQLGHPVHETLYRITTDCNGYQPWDIEFYTLAGEEC